MKIKIKKITKNAVIPKYAKDGDAGIDLTVTEVNRLDREHIQYSFGLANEIPKGYVGYLFPRSSCYKAHQLLSNCVGVIDSGYRGELKAVFIGTQFDTCYKIGDRAVQLIIMPIPFIELVEVEELSETERGSGGFGSTGK